MSWTNWHLSREFTRLNKRYFHNRLPKVRVHYVPIRKGFMGYATDYEIALKPFLKQSSKCSTSVLLHEMAHLKFRSQGLHEVNHGPKWVREMRRLHREGAFDSILYAP